MTDLELMQQARDALVYLWDGCPADKALVERLDDRLAQPEQDSPKPSEQYAFERGFQRAREIAREQWQGLTDEEIKNHWLIAMQSVEGTVLPIPEFALAIERALKEKNHG